MLESLGNIGDFIGGIAVLVTLVYLAAQVRQNTQSVDTASRQEIVAGFRSHNRLYFQPGANDAFSVGIRRYPEMPREQLNLFTAIQTDHALFFQSVFALHEAGTLEGETYEAYLAYFSASVATPGGARWWSEISPIFTRRMVQTVDGRVAEGGLADIRSLEAFREPPAA